MFNEQTRPHRIFDNELEELLTKATGKKYKKVHNNYEKSTDIIDLCIEQKLSMVSSLFLLIENMKGGRANPPRILVLEGVLAKMLFFDEVEVYVLRTELQKKKVDVRLLNLDNVEKFIKAIRK